MPHLIGDLEGSCVVPGNFVGIEHDGGGNLLVTDNVADTVSVMSPACAVMSSCSVATNSTNALGVTHDGSRMWVTDTDGQDVDLYDLACNYGGSFSVTAQTTFPEGITYNQYTDTLLVVDGSGGNNVYEYSTAGVLLNTYPIAGSSQDGIAFNAGLNLYVIYDSGSDSVSTYDSFFNPVSSFSGTSNSGFGPGEGVAIIGASCFVMATGSDTLVQYECFSAVPSVPQWGLLFLAMLLIGAAAWRLTRRPAVGPA